MIKKLITSIAALTVFGALSLSSVHAQSTNAMAGMAMTNAPEAAAPASTDPVPDPGGIKTGAAGDAQDAGATHFVVSAPADLSDDDKKDTNKVAAYTDAKKAADDYAAKAKLEPLAVKLAD